MDPKSGLLYAREVQRAWSLLLLVVAACGSSPFPPAVVPSSPTSVEWPDTGAVVLEDVAVLDYRRELDQAGAYHLVAQLDHRRRIKILTDEGLSAATVELDSSPLAEVLQVMARSVRPDGKVVQLETVRGLPMPGSEAAPNIRQLRFTIPGAVVGGLVEYRYQCRFADAALVSPWVFAGRYPVLRSELSVVADAGLDLDFRYGEGSDVKQFLPLRRTLDDGRERLVFVKQNLPAFYDEPFMPHPARLAPWVATMVVRAHMGNELWRLETWNDIAQYLNSHYLKPVGGDLLSGSPQERYRKLRSQLTPIAFLGLGGVLPTPAARLAKGSGASSRDAAARLLSAFGDTGVPMGLALLASPSGPPVLEDFPALYPFVRAAVALRANAVAVNRKSCGPREAQPACHTAPDSYLLLDASCHHCRYGELPWDVQGGRALLLLDDGVRWQDIPLDAPKQHQLALHAQLHFAPNGEVTGKVDGQAQGNWRGLVGTALVDKRGADQALSSLLLGEPAIAKLHEVKEGDSSEAVLAFSAQLAGKLEKQGYESYHVRPTWLFGPALPGDFPTSRRHPYLLAAPRSLEEVATLDLPVGYEVELPTPVRISTPFGEYAAAFERRERTLTYVRRLTLASHVIEPKDWDAWRRFVASIDKAEQGGIRIWVAE